MNSLYDPNDDRVKKIVVDYARAYLGMTEILSNDYSRLDIYEISDPNGHKYATVYEYDPQGRWCADYHELDSSIKTIVNNAILDLLTKE